MRYPSLTWFEVSNLNIACDIPKQPGISWYMQAFVTLDGTIQTHLLRSRPPTSTMKKTWMPDLTRRRWSTPSTNSCSRSSGEAREEGLQGPGHPTDAATLHIFGRGYGGWFSPSTGQRSGLYVHPVWVAPVSTRPGPQLTNPGYSWLSQCIWWYSWLTPDSDINSLWWTSWRVLRWHADPVWLQRQCGLRDWNSLPHTAGHAELGNSIQQNHLVRNQDGCTLTTLACVEWEHLQVGEVNNG